VEFSGTKQRPGVHLLVRQLTDISHGSVATRLRCGGVFNDDFIGNLLSVSKIDHLDTKLRAKLPRHVAPLV